MRPSAEDHEREEWSRIYASFGDVNMRSIVLSHLITTIILSSSYPPDHMENLSLGPCHDSAHFRKDERVSIIRYTLATFGALQRNHLRTIVPVIYQEEKMMEKISGTRTKCTINGDHDGFSDRTEPGPIKRSSGDHEPPKLDRTESGGTLPCDDLTCPCRIIRPRQ